MFKSFESKIAIFVNDYNKLPYQNKYWRCSNFNYIEKL